MKKKNMNNKKEKPSYAKMFKEQIKKESTHPNKSNIAKNDKNENNKENIPLKNEKQEVKPKAGINFDNLSDWNNIVYPGEKEIKEIIKNAEENNIQYNNDNNNNYEKAEKFELNKNDFQNNNIINQIKEEDENNLENQQLENFKNNLNPNNNIGGGVNYGIGVGQNRNNLHEFSVNTSEFTNKNDILNPYDNISLGTNNIDNNIIDKKNNNQNIFNDNIVSQIKPIEYGLGIGNNINNVIKEEDSLEQEEENNKNNNIDNNMGINMNNNINELNDIKAERDIMEQMEEEINLSMDQMNELAGNLQGNYNKGKNKNIKKNDKKDIGNKNKKIFLKNDKSSKGINNQNVKSNNNINNNKNFNNNMRNNNIKINNVSTPNINQAENLNNANKEISLNNVNNNANNYFNANNFSFKPTNIQQISTEEVTKFIQNTQQQASYPIPQQSYPQQQISYPQQQVSYPQQQVSYSQKQASYPQQQINNQIMNNQPQIINGLNINNSNNENNTPLYPSPYPMVIGQNSNPPQQIYNIPYNINMPQQIPPGMYPFPNQNINYPQFPMNGNPQNQSNKNPEKKKVNYKPKSLKEYKEKYNNGIKEHRGGLGANIGGEEWEHKKEQNMKVKKYSEMIKNQNKEKENNFKKKFKLKNELNDQLYDSLSEEVLDEEKKEKKQIISDNNKEKPKKEIKKENENEKRPDSNKVRYLMNLKKEKENKNKEAKEEKKGKPQGKYSKYTKIVIESIDKSANPNEKKLGKIYTTFKPKQPQRRPSTKDKKQLIKPIVNNDNKKRSQSTGFKNHIYKKEDYDDELTKQFMSPNPNNYNGFINNKDDNNNFMITPTFEIENLINKKNQYDDKIKEIKKFLKK